MEQAPASSYGGDQISLGNMCVPMTNLSLQPVLCTVTYAALADALGGVCVQRGTTTSVSHDAHVKRTLLDWGFSE